MIDCSLNDQVKSSMLLGQHLIFDILERRDHRESLSAVDGALRCCGSAGTVRTSMAVPCRADTCRPWHAFWTWHQLSVERFFCSTVFAFSYNCSFFLFRVVRYRLGWLNCQLSSTRQYRIITSHRNAEITVECIIIEKSLFALPCGHRL